MITDKKIIDIILDIFYHIKKNDDSMQYWNWYVGTTNNPDKKEIQYKSNANISHFKSWNLENKATASVLKEYLTEKGCIECKSELAELKHIFKDATFVFIFRSKI